MRWEERRGEGDPGGLEEQSWVLFCRAQDSALALCIPGRHWATWTSVEDLVPDISLTWYWSPQMLNPYCQLAQRLLQPRHAVCPVYFKSLKIAILDYQCQANARHSSFSQTFPNCSWLHLRLQNPKAVKANRLYVFFGGCQPKRKLCPWENWRIRSSKLPRNSFGINGHFLLLMYNVVLKLAKTQAIDGWMDDQTFQH